MSDLEQEVGYYSSGSRSLLLFFWLFLGIALSLFIFAGALEMVIINPPGSLEELSQIRNEAISNIPHNLSNLEMATKKATIYSFYYLEFAKAFWISWIVFAAGLLTTLVILQALRKQGVISQFKRKATQYKNLFDQERFKRVQAEKDSDRSNKYLYQSHEYINEGFAVIGKDERLIHANQNGVDMFISWSSDVESFQQMEGQHIKNFIPRYEKSELSEAIISTATKKKAQKKEVQLNENTWITIRTYPAPEGVYFYFKDISSIKESSAKNGDSTSNNLINRVAGSSPFAMAITDMHWDYTIVSDSWKQQFKLEGNLIGKNHKHVLPNFPGKWEALESVLMQGKVVQSDETMFKLNGQEEWINWQIRPWNDAEGNPAGYIIYALVVTESKQNKDRLTQQRERERQLAYHDVLTGLPNRQLFYDRLNMSLSQAYRQLDKVALLFLDLDGFKAVNDNLGHDIGDMLLKEVSTRLLKCVRDSDTVARIGGDEFTVILNGIADEKDASFVADKILEQVNLPIKLGQHTVKVGTSIGISLYPEDGSASSELIKKSDTAMYWSKESGKNTYHFFSDDAGSTEHEGRIGEVGAPPESLDSELKTALQKGELEVNFQPQYNLETRKIFGLEALLRWNHPEKGRLKPAEFIELAEKTGSILPIGEWVIKTACERMKEWRDSGHEEMMVSVNLSARQLKDESLIKRIKRTLEATQLDPKNLGIEISESIIMDNEELVKSRLTELKELGVIVLVDDFGLGFSPLNNLKDFPVDIIKIHKSFVQKSDSSDEDKGIVKTMIALAKNMDMKIIGQGVETEEQANILFRNGCTHVQGFLFGKPVHPKDVPEFFKPIVSIHKEE